MVELQSILCPHVRRGVLYPTRSAQHRSLWLLMFVAFRLTQKQFFSTTWQSLYRKTERVTWAYGFNRSKQQLWAKTLTPSTGKASKAAVALYNKGSSSDSNGSAGHSRASSHHLVSFC